MRYLGLIRRWQLMEMIQMKIVRSRIHRFVRCWALLNVDWRRRCISCRSLIKGMERCNNLLPTGPTTSNSTKAFPTASKSPSNTNVHPSCSTSTTQAYPTTWPSSGLSSRRSPPCKKKISIVQAATLSKYFPTITRSRSILTETSFT